MTINDATKFLDLFYMYNVPLPSTPEEYGKYSTSRENLRPLEWEYYDPRNNDAKIKVTDDEDENVLEQFLSFLQSGDAGISLFESNENYDSFQPLKIGLNGSVDRTALPCSNN